VPVVARALVVVLVVLLALGVAALIAVEVVVLRLRRANRVSQAHNSGAPLYWLVWPGRPARLHRRLRRTVVLARSGCPPTPAGRFRRRAPELSAEAELAARVEHQAAAISRELVLSARLRGGARRRIIEPAARDVAQLEHVATRIAALAGTRSMATGSTGATDGLQALGDDVEARHAAYEEIAAIEVRALGQHHR
jgi:hypothetical protein